MTTDTTKATLLISGTASATAMVLYCAPALTSTKSVVERCLWQSLIDLTSLTDRDWHADLTLADGQIDRLD
jgi:FPC/CPF motif-containing protein YcgG